MSAFDSGVTGYVHAQATVDVYFPIDHKGNEYVCCGQCPFFGYQSRKCTLTGRPASIDPNKYIGHECILTRTEEQDG